ncbi:10263_t:CDS:1, partial [Ambispora gerdemannii]
TSDMLFMTCIKKVQDNVSVFSNQLDNRLGSKHADFRYTQKIGNKSPKIWNDSETEIGFHPQY